MPRIVKQKVEFEGRIEEREVVIEGDELLGRVFLHDDTVLNQAALPGPSERAEWEDLVRWALARLAPECREAFLLKHMEDLEYEEMARLTGAGISALKMRVKRAREQLQVILTEAERV